MSKNVKHYVITGIILGCIAMCGGALVGAANLITKNQIEKNETKKINKGIAEIFGEGSVVDSTHEIKGDDKYLDCYYTVNKEAVFEGYAFKTTGSNMYGKISMLVAIKTNFSIGHVYLISDEQTYASTLEDEYVTPYNNDRGSLDDVSCGATYGAKLVKEMANEAQSWAITNLGGNVNG